MDAALRSFQPAEETRRAVDRPQAQGVRSTRAGPYQSLQIDMKASRARHIPA